MRCVVGVVIRAYLLLLLLLKLHVELVARIVGGLLHLRLH